MRTIIVDDDEISMELLAAHCRQVSDIRIVGQFTNAEDALAFVKKEKIEFALLDVEMPQMNGLKLGEELRKLCPQMVLIYVTGHSKYVVEMLKGKADYCIIKPYDGEAIKDAFARAKLLGKRLEKSMRVETFGRFEVFAKEKAIHFSNAKARELFAYCVHREGANVTMEEAIDVLWPDRAYDDKVKRLYRKAIGAIIKALTEYDVHECFENKRGSCQIRKDEMECDLFQFMQGEKLKPVQKEQLRMGYMTEYSWAEERMSEFLAVCPDLYEE